MASTSVVQEEVQDATHIDLDTMTEPPATDSHDSRQNFRALEKWNQPRGNIYRSLAAFWSFLVMGANDAAYGVSAASREK